MTESEKIVRRLDSLIRLVAAGVCANKSQRDSIAILNAAGLTPKEIAEFLQDDAEHRQRDAVLHAEQESAKKTSTVRALPSARSDITGS